MVVPPRFSVPVPWIVFVKLATVVLLEPSVMVLPMVWLKLSKSKVALIDRPATVSALTVEIALLAAIFKVPPLIVVIPV